MAIRHGIKGFVLNGNDGVRIHAEGLPGDISSFADDISILAPEASSIQLIDTWEAEFSFYEDFTIRKSQDGSEQITEISPDIAVCRECLDDMHSQPHRMHYPFINCTNCGPRFTIIRDLPYDRAMTTMEPFVMCPECQKEYTDILDRRFHAQPVACNVCGPVYELVQGHLRITGMELILRQTLEILKKGQILAVKGLGGYHLACDALNESAVAALRSRKNREGKPFAVMFRNIQTAREFLEINELEEKLMTSWRRPIVILRNIKDGRALSPSVSNNFSTTGAMLPFMPFHHLLFEQLETPAIVLTSGNLSDEPIIIHNHRAEEQLSAISDAILSYNRDIHNRTDDSVAMVIGEQPRLVRRSRGYVPSPQHLELDTEGIFATGAELVNCFALGRGKQAILSQHIGDLKNLETLDFYTESFRRFCQMFRVRLNTVAVDLHPDYLSTRFGEDHARENGLEVSRIQHHHAHIASCMAENHLDEPVIGISLDGVGLGTDGNIWGFEVMQADLCDFKRISHLEYIGQPGGDLATQEPWRMALSYIMKYTDDLSEIDHLAFLAGIEKQNLALIRQAILMGINCPLTSSAGRLFDAVAAMTGACIQSSFHAEAPMRLEDLIDESIPGRYDIQAGAVIDPGEMIRQILRDIRKGVGPATVSTRFHRAMVHAVTESARYARELTGLGKVALSGGVFQNRFLLGKSIAELRKSGFEAFSQSAFPSNDGGIALGQLAIAAKRRASNYK
jgi:hydrogenase maturation protein HypF